MTVCGLKRLMRTAAPVPSAVPTLVSAARVRWSPVVGARGRSLPAGSGGRGPGSCTGSSGSAASRSSAARPTTVSQQPRRPQPQTRSGSPREVCPTSPDESAGAAQQLVGHDHAAADADLAGQVDQVRGARLGPHRPLGDRRQVGVVLHADGAVEVDRGPAGPPARGRRASRCWARRWRRRRRCAPGPGRRRSPRPAPRRWAVAAASASATRPATASSVRSGPSAGTSRAIRCSNSTSPRRSSTSAAA